MIELHPRQFWMQGKNRFHKECGSPVYGDDQGNRYCTDKDCMGSYYSINPMEDLVGKPLTDEIDHQ